MKPLSNFGIAYRNIGGKPGSAVALTAIVTILAFTLYSGMVLSKSLDNGMNSLRKRLGADIAVVPIGSAVDYENTILACAPTGFYFDSVKEKQVADVNCVTQVTAQFYLATLADSGCCSGEVQIVGIDFDTDFVVQPWIANIFNRQLGDNEVIVGCEVSIDYDNTVRYFDNELNVAARLGKSSTGMDQTVFMSLNTARETARKAQMDGNGFEGVDIDNSISVVLVNTDGYDVSDVADNVLRIVNGVSVVESQGIYSNIATTLNFFKGMANAIMILLSIFAVLLLAVLFAMTINNRKKEFAILRVMGATRKKLAAIVLTEGVFISLLGTIFGIIFAFIIVVPFAGLIGNRMGMPLLLPDFESSMKLLAFSMILSVGIGPLAACYSSIKISRAETYTMIREGE
ncbi:MAG: ABC transporter permease [Treponema sp.]|jgi:putative ABC transport system permease protein|nr:ABC transporter permease [Treponema sp.]